MFVMYCKSNKLENSLKEIGPQTLQFKNYVHVYVPAAFFILPNFHSMYSIKQLDYELEISITCKLV